MTIEAGTAIEEQRQWSGGRGRKIQEIRAVAKARGIKTARMGKADIIRAVRRDEKNFPCCGTAVGGYCDQCECAWRDNRLPEPAANRLPG